MRWIVGTVLTVMLVSSVETAVALCWDDQETGAWRIEQIGPLQGSRGIVIGGYRQEDDILPAHPLLGVVEDGNTRLFIGATVYRESPSRFEQGSMLVEILIDRTTLQAEAFVRTLSTGMSRRILLHPTKTCRVP